MTLVDNSTAKRLGILCFYDKNGRAAKFLDGFLEDLMRNLTDLVVIVNGKIDDDARKMFSKYTDTIMVRENKGLDVAAYKQALLTIGWEKLETYDEVLCLNDTIMGPVYPFKEMFETMSRKDVDFWGITAYAGETVNDEKIPTHLQAYWHAYRRSLVSAQAFHEYWENMPLWKDYAEVTRKHEMTFTKHFAQLGFKWASYIDWRKYKGYSSYPLLYMPMQMLRDDRCDGDAAGDAQCEHNHHVHATHGRSDHNKVGQHQPPVAACRACRLVAGRGYPHRYIHAQHQQCRRQGDEQVGLELVAHFHL